MSTSSPRSAAAGTLVPLGRISATHDLRGELRARLYNPSSTALDDAEHGVLRFADGSVEERRLVAVRNHKPGLLLVQLDGCTSIDDAEPLVGAEILLPYTELPELGADEVYHFQLIGLRVETTDGRDLGRIAEVMDLAAHAVCVVRGHGREILIPFVDAFVRDVDLANGRMLVEPVPGLIDDG